MKKYIFILFGLLISSCNSQNNIEEKYNLMPWPKEIKETTGKFIIDNGYKTIEISKFEKVI